VTSARLGAGMAVLEYVGLVAAVALMLAGLLVLRAHTVGRRAPVRAVPAVVHLLGRPGGLITVDRPPPPVRPPRPPHRPRPPRPPVVVDVPDWLLR